MKKRVLSLLLTLALCFTMLPAAAFAAEADPAGQETQSDSGTGKVQSAGEKNGTAVQAGETHEHFLCGGTTCNQEGHALEDGMTTFEPWDEKAITTAGTYRFYLTGDISGFTVREGVNLTLCLNGYNITSSSTVQGEDVITVKPGATFTLCDCKQGGTKTDYGTIGHNRPDQWNGRGVTVEASTFYMYGGKISNNTVGNLDNSKGIGGGVVVCNKGAFYMIGGEITGNTARSGGGVDVGAANGIYDDDELLGGTFSMTGGKIYGNNCVSKGGGVYVNSTATNFTVSGSAQITGNYYTGAYFGSSTQDDNNVYLGKYTNENTGETNIATIKVDGTLTGSIGVTTEDVGHLVAEGVSPSAKKYFFSDNSNYRLKYDSTASTLTMVAVTEHAAHPICGDASCTKHGDSIDSWTAVSDLSKISGNGYYYLTDNVTISSTWEPKDGVVLCLNDYTITANGDFDAITVGEGVTFTLCDCIGGGEITHDEGKSGTGVYVAGAAEKYANFDMYSGTITGNTGHTVTVSGNETTRGGGVYVDDYARFHMNGGSITGQILHRIRQREDHGQSGYGRQIQQCLCEAYV